VYLPQRCTHRHTHCLCAHRHTHCLSKAEICRHAPHIHFIKRAGLQLTYTWHTRALLNADIYTHFTQTPTKGQTFKNLAVLTYTVFLKQTFSTKPGPPLGPGEMPLTPQQIEAKQTEFATLFRSWVQSKTAIHISIVSLVFV
jgi:hypothetical protein